MLKQVSDALTDFRAAWLAKHHDLAATLFESLL
jgi:hypothetical protein